MTLLIAVAVATLGISSLSAEGGCCPSKKKGKDAKKEKTEEKTQS